MSDRSSPVGAPLRAPFHMTSTNQNYEAAQAEFFALGAYGDTPRARASLTRKFGFISTPAGAKHFISHPRDYPSATPQLSALLDADIAAHPIFAEIDADKKSRWRQRSLRSGVTIQTTFSYSLPFLCGAIEAGVPYAELARTHKASPRDGNTLGNYSGNFPIVPRSYQPPKGVVRGPQKTKRLSQKSEDELERHRLNLLAERSASARGKYARTAGMIDVTLEDDTLEKVHLLGGRKRDDGLPWYFPFPASMSVEKLLASAPGIEPGGYILTLDRAGSPILTFTPLAIEVARLVWLIASGVEGLHRGNLQELLKSVPDTISFRDGKQRHLKLANLVEGATR